MNRHLHSQRQIVPRYSSPEVGSKDLHLFFASNLFRCCSSSMWTSSCYSRWNLSK